MGKNSKILPFSPPHSHLLTRERHEKNRASDTIVVLVILFFSLILLYFYDAVFLAIKDNFERKIQCHGITQTFVENFMSASRSNARLNFLVNMVQICDAVIFPCNQFSTYSLKL